MATAAPSAANAPAMAEPSPPAAPGDDHGLVRESHPGTPNEVIT